MKKYCFGSDIVIEDDLDNAPLVYQKPVLSFNRGDPVVLVERKYISSQNSIDGKKMLVTINLGRGRFKGFFPQRNPTSAQFCFSRDKRKTLDLSVYVPFNYKLNSIPVTSEGAIIVPSPIIFHCETGCQI
jgi:hypothetical protein